MNRLVCVIFVAGSTILFGQTTEKPKPGTIEGVVTKVGTGEPISGVRVTVTPESGLNSTATTNTQGRFTVPNLQPGRYTIEVSRALFVRSRRSGTLLNVTLAANQHLRDVHIQLAPAAVIAGRVYDENRQPVRAVRVDAMRYEYRDGARVLVSAGMAQSDDRGEYRIFNLQPGTYLLRATQPGPALLTILQSTTLSGVYYPGVIDPQDAVSVSADSGAEVNAIDIGLIRIPRTSVRLKIAGLPQDRPATPVFSASRRDRGIVDLVTLQAERLADGVYRLSSFVPGTYDIFIRQSALVGQQPVLQTGQIAVNIGNEDVDAGSVAMRQAVVVTGLIRSSEPTSSFDLRKVTLRLSPFNAAPGGGAAGVIAADGSFTIPNVPHWNLRVNVALPAGVYLESARYGGRDVTDSGIQIDGDPEGPLELIVAGPQRFGAIEGIVRNRDGQPLADSVVVIVPAPDQRMNPDAIRSGTTDQLGHFSIQGLRPGTYTVLAWEDLDPGAHLNPDLLIEFESRGTRVNLERGSRQVVELRILPQPN